MRTEELCRSTPFNKRWIATVAKKLCDGFFIVGVLPSIRDGLRRFYSSRVGNAESVGVLPSIRDGLRQVLFNHHLCEK